MVDIRKARREDAKVAWDIRRAAILNQCINHYPIDDLKMWTSGNPSQQYMDAVAEHFYVATHENQIVGTGMVNLATGKIDAVFVRPSHMKIGVGRKIMEHLESLARDKGLKELYLESTLNAAPFYRVCGFEGEKLGKYESPAGVVLDSVPMVKVLVSNDSLQPTRFTTRS
jgi:N-acetylglutamate synthase-like GNAT family acetyltransferase